MNSIIASTACIHNAIRNEWPKRLKNQNKDENRENATAKRRGTRGKDVIKYNNYGELYELGIHKATNMWVVSSICVEEPIILKPNVVETNISFAERNARVHSHTHTRVYQHLCEMNHQYHIFSRFENEFLYIQPIY